MKKIFIIFLSNIIFANGQIELNNSIEDIKNGTEQMKEGVNKAVEGNGNKEKSTNQNGNENSNSSDNTKTTSTSNVEKPTLKTYQNFDFVAGEKILFEDNFSTDMDGEFPAHWELVAGQGVLNKLEGDLAFYIIEGNYGTVKPRIKGEDYLGDEFTVEFDYYNYRPQDGSGAYGIVVMLTSFEEGNAHDNNLIISSTNIVYSGAEVYLTKDYSADMYGEDKFSNKFHHISIGFKNHQMKVYVDQTRVLVIPDTKVDYRSVAFGGIGSNEYPIIFKNIKIAEGGKMNMLDKISTDGKIVTHGILFDVNKASIKPESMGVINQIFQLLKENADLKFEIGGFTDSDGDDNSNLKLSEQRAIAVKDQLVSMGIVAERLTAKGYGEINPIDVNTTPEGKANNRRVEFKKR